MSLPAIPGYNVAMPDSVITATFGPFVTGIMMQQLFLGVFCVQVYDYWRMFQTDTMFNRVIVSALTVLTVLQGTMDYVNLYRNAVTYYGNFDKFDEENWSLWWEIGVTAIIGTVAQIFFLERCYSATKNKIMGAIVGLAVLTSLGFGIASSVEFQRIVRLSAVPSIPKPIVGWLTATAVLDVTISGILIWSLLRVKTPFRKTEAVITKIIRVTAETSTVTASIAVINLVLYLALPGLAYHLLPQLIMGKMYAISVMITLSSRKDLQEIMSTPATTSYYESTRGRAPTAGSIPNGGVVVTTSYQQNVDDTKSRGHDIELGTRTIDTVRFARQDDNVDDDESLEAGKRSHHPFAP